MYLRSTHSSLASELGVWFIYSRKSRPSTEMVVTEDGTVKEVTLSAEETLAKHKESLLKLAQSMNLSVAAIFEEVGSGETIAARPEINKMLDHLAVGIYDGFPILGVLVMSVTRLARGETRDQGDILEIFKYSNTKIVTPRKVYDPNDPADYKYLEFEFFMSRQEWSLIRERMEEGKFSTVSSGQYIGTYPPFGFRKAKVGKLKTLEPSDSAKVVYDMFDWGYNDGLTEAQIWRKLISLGIPSSKGGEWEYQVVYNIMHNEHYIGKIRWGMHATKRVLDPDTRRPVKKRVYEKDYLLFDGLHQGIVPEEWFYGYQEKHPRLPPVKKDSSLRNPLAGLLKCRKCGKRMRREGDGRRHPGCARYTHVAAAQCGCKSARVDMVMDLVLKSLRERVANLEIEREAGGNQRAVEEHLAFIEAKDRELAAVEKAKTTLWDRFDGLCGDALPVEEFQKRMAQLVSRQTRLTEERNELVASMPEEIDYDAKIVLVHEAIAMMESPDASPSDVNELLRRVLDRIEYWNSGEWGVNNIELDIFLR